MRALAAFVMLAACLCVAGISNAQDLPANIQWVKQFGTRDGDVPEEIVVGPNGSSYIVGQSGEFKAGTGFGGLDGYITRFDAGGAQQWIAPLGTSQTDTATGVVIDNVGNAYVSWLSVFSTDADGYLSKIDSFGNVLWTRMFDVNYRTLPRDIAFDRQGNVIIGGISGADIQSPDAFVAAFSPSGSKLYDRHFGTAMADRAEAISVDSKGNIILVGDTEGNLGATNAGSSDAFVAKLDPTTGNLLWVRQFGGSELEYATNVAVGPDDSVYFTGWGVKVGMESFGDFDAYVGRISADGTPSWLHQFGTSGFDDSGGIAVNANGEVFIAGSTTGALFGPNQGEFDIYVAGFDDAGKRFFGEQFGGTGRDHATALAQVENSSFFRLAGVVSTTLGNNTSAGDYDTVVLSLQVPEPTSLVFIEWGTGLLLLLIGKNQRERQ